MMPDYFDYLDELRTYELELTLKKYGHLFSGKRLLEVGCGSGVQMRHLKSVCATVKGVEIPGSVYAERRPEDILEFDGTNLPFESNSFDVIYSSNVLEHCTQPEGLNAEMRRVLASGGVGIHLLPSHFWRIWTHVTHYPALLKRIRRYRSNVRSGPQGCSQLHRRSKLQLLGGLLMDRRHGEYGNRVTEMLEFHPSSWNKRFTSWGWRLDAIEPGGLFYTGKGLLSDKWSFASRRRWSAILGSACVIFVVSDQSSESPEDER